MNAEESQKIIKSYNSPKTLLDQFESSLNSFEKSQQGFKFSIFQEQLNQLAFTCVSLNKTSLKSSIDSTIRSLNKLISQHPKVPLTLELIQFYSNIGKSLKRLANYELSEFYYIKGINLGKHSKIQHPVLVILLVSLSKLQTKQNKLIEALSSSKEAASLCQDIVVNCSNFSNSELAQLTCKTYYQVAVQEELLHNYDQSLLWCQKAERIFLQNPESLSNFSVKISKTMKTLQLKFPNKNSYFSQSIKTTRDHPKAFEKNNLAKPGNFPTNRSKTIKSPASTMRTVRNSETYLKSGVSSRKRIDSEKFLKVENGLLENLTPIEKVNFEENEKFYYKEPEKAPYYETGKINTVKTFMLNVACQTDEVEKTKTDNASTFTDEIEFGEKKEKVFRSTQGKALVRASVIDIRLEEYEVKYYLNSELNKVLVVVSDSVDYYEMEIGLDSELPVLDFINQKLHPRIDMDDKGVFLKEETSSTLFEATILKDSHKLELKLQERNPRCEIQVTFIQESFKTSKLFRISEIFPDIKNTLKSAEFLIMSFDIQGDSIKLILPQKYQPELLYYKRHDFDDFPQTPIKVSKMQYSGFSRYLFQAFNSASPFALILDDQLLSKVSSIPTDLLDLHIEKICDLLKVKNSGITIKEGPIPIVYSLSKSPANESLNIEELRNDVQAVEMITKIQTFYRGYLMKKSVEKDVLFYSEFNVSGRNFHLTFADSKLNRKLKIEATELKKVHYLTLNYPILFDQPFKESIPKQLRMVSGELVLKKYNSPDGYFFRSTSELAEKFCNVSNYVGWDEEEINTNKIPDEMYEKIIYRTCIKKNNLMYQINMVLHRTEDNEDILQFFVRNGPMAENSQKFVIDLMTVCKKSGFACTQLDQIGKYIVENMITFAGQSVSFLNFDDKHSKAESYLIKLQAFFRGFLTRKRLSKKVSKIILKAYINSVGRKWLCLFKSDTTNLFLNIVSKTDILHLQLNLLKISNENPYPSLKVFFKTRLMPKLKVEFVDQKIRVSGIEEFIIVN